MQRRFQEDSEDYSLFFGLESSESSPGILLSLSALGARIFYVLLNIGENPRESSETSRSTKGGVSQRTSFVAWVVSHSCTHSCSSRRRVQGGARGEPQARQNDPLSFKTRAAVLTTGRRASARRPGARLEEVRVKIPSSGPKKRKQQNLARARSQCPSPHPPSSRDGDGAQNTTVLACCMISGAHARVWARSGARGVQIVCLRTIPNSRKRTF